jgi:hypothetical protein
MVSNGRKYWEKEFLLHSLLPGYLGEAANLTLETLENFLDKVPMYYTSERRANRLCKRY